MTAECKHVILSIRFLSLTRNHDTLETFQVEPYVFRYQSDFEKREMGNTGWKRKLFRKLLAFMTSYPIQEKALQNSHIETTAMIG